MSKIVRGADGKAKLYIHRDELVVPASENVSDVEADRQRKLEECTITSKHYAGNCETCKNRVIFHCPECRQQVTGCLCTLAKKVDALKAEADRNLFGN